MATPKLAVRPEIAFRRVLVAIDFSASSRHALRFALGIAHHYGARLDLFHVVHGSGFVLAGPEALAQAVELAGDDLRNLERELVADHNLDGLEHRAIVASGDICDSLHEVVRNESIDLLVLGTHGRTGLRKVVLGSVAEEMLRSIACPALSVGPHAEVAAAGSVRFDRIVYATDFAPGTTAALPYALGLAEQHDARLTIVHVLPPVPISSSPPMMLYTANQVTAWQAGARADAVSRMKMMVQGVALVHAPEFLALPGFPAEVILAEAALRRADLIVMGAGASTSPAVASHRPWTVTHEVASQAPCPVLTVTQ